MTGPKEPSRSIRRALIATGWVPPSVQITMASPDLLTAMSRRPLLPPVTGPAIGTSCELKPAFANWGAASEAIAATHVQGTGFEAG